MERPASQLENVKPSGLKPPSRLPGLSSHSGRTLLETSQSDLNAKAAGGREAMPPPSVTVKHKISGLPEPPTKRKTLIERAGEPLNPVRSHIPGARANGASHARGPSHSTGTHRNTSASSTVSNVGSIRTASRQNTNRHVGGRPPSAAEPRASAEDDSETGISGRRKGTPTISFNTQIPTKTLRKAGTYDSLRGKPSADTSYRSQHSDTCSRTSSSDASSKRSVSAEHSTRGTSVSTHQMDLTKEANNGDGTREVSISTALAKLHLTPKRSSNINHRPSLERIKEEVSPSKIPKFSCTPSLRHAQSTQALQSPSPLKHKSSMNGLRTPVSNFHRKVDFPVFLTKEKLTPTPAWDTNGRIEDMEQLYAQLRSQFASAADSKTALEESLTLYKGRVQELTQLNNDLSSSNRTISTDLERTRNDLHTTTTDLRQSKRDHERDMQDADRKHERELSNLYAKQEQESRRLESELEQIAKQGEKKMEEAQKTWARKKDDESADLTTQHWEELEELRSGHQREMEKLRGELDEMHRSRESRASESASEVQELRESIMKLRGDVEAANSTAMSLRSQIEAAEARNASLEQEKAALVSKTHFLEGNQEAQSLEFTSMRDKLQEALDARDSTLDMLRKEEMLRRKLNATILELRGNIRVFIRMRPLLGDEEDPARVDYPDADNLDGSKEMVVHAPTTLSATGKERNEKHNYAFDRIFGPKAANKDVFDECRDLIQSVVDGYNVSILSYGQTGSGKTFGMSGPDGIIPSAVAMLLSEMARLDAKGWSYAVHASFVEVYNETLNDLLGDAKSWDEGDDAPSGAAKGKKKDKHEIHHDPITGKTTVTNLSSVGLWPPPESDGSWPPPAPAPDPECSAAGDPATSYTEKAVANLLDTAAKNRRVAATKSNERSSRSHSIFMLTLRGSCAATGESSEGVLNLVDLAGSERLKQSGAEGDRKRETQAINRSLASLGDVVSSLSGKGQGAGEHVPYRNSKLTYLLQSSLGGTSASGKSSRTLMLLHLSPLQAHWQESRSSLMFGNKVHGTHIGAAKKK